VAAGERPRGALEQEAAPERGWGLPERRGEEAVEVEAGEMHPPRKLRAVGCRVVDALEHAVDEQAQAVGRHGRHSGIIEARARRRLIVFADVSGQVDRGTCVRVEHTFP